MVLFLASCFLVLISLVIPQKYDLLLHKGRTRQGALGSAPDCQRRTGSDGGVGLRLAVEIAIV